MADDSDDDLVSYRPRAQKPLDPTLMATNCAGMVVLLTGLGFLFGAIANTRVEHVSDYSQEVHEWEKYRPLLKATQISMSLNLPETAHQPGGLVESQLMQKEEEDWAFHDTEEMNGIEQYQPLKHVTDVELPCLYSNCSMVALNAADSLQPRDDWNDQLLPSWAEAPRASFHFVTRGTGGQQSSFSTPAIPLVFDLPTVGQTPQPRMYCYGPGHGVFRRPGTCHHAQRLTDLCVVLEPNGEGGWKLRQAVVAQFFYNNSRRTGTFGCNPQTGYEAATYHRDPCWGPVPNRQLCRPDAGLAHVVRVTVRAWHDPYIKAAELTHGSMDFGLSGATELITGSVLLTMGCLILLVPNILRSRCAMRRLKKLTSKAGSPQARSFGRTGPGSD